MDGENVVAVAAYDDGRDVPRSVARGAELPYDCGWHVSPGRHDDERGACWTGVPGVAGCALVGGETAEMPGFYPENEYDLAGFSVGIAEKERILGRDRVKEGDIAIAFPSSGVHSNGFSLVRKVFSIDSDPAVLRRHEAELGTTLGEALLTPTRIYVREALSAIAASEVHAICHITGGGFYENIPRVLPEGLGISIRKSDVRILPVFDVIQRTGGIPERDMFNTFNMGVGMIAIVDRNTAESALCAVQGSYIIGEIVKSSDEVRIW